MSTNRSGGDFGCCGSFARGCAVDKGCVYGSMRETQEEQTDALLYAMIHCNVFKKMFVEKDIEFIKTWKSQVDENGKVQPCKVKPERQSISSNMTDALKEAQALLKSLGL